MRRLVSQTLTPVLALQVGHKSFMYMHLYAEATLAVVETPHKEIQFKQIKGDFQTLQGKIMVQQDDLSEVLQALAQECRGCRSSRPSLLTSLKSPLSSSEPHPSPVQGNSPGIILKYAVEVEIPRSVALMGILDPLLERIVYQDIPTNLSAVKAKVEGVHSGMQPRWPPVSLTTSHIVRFQLFPI